MLDGALHEARRISSRRALLLLLLVALEDVEQEGVAWPLCCMKTSVTTLKSRVTPWHANGTATARNRVRSGAKGGAGRGATRQRKRKGTAVTGYWAAAPKRWTRGTRAGA